MKDPYEVLGVSHDATDDEIKKAYKKMALEWHPDRHGGSSEAEDKFKDINAAFQAIGDPEKRARHDMGGRSNGFPSFHDVFVHSSFESMFGGQFGGFRVHRSSAASKRIVASVSLEEAYAGTEKVLVVRENRKCAACGGLSAKQKNEPCPACGGTGHISSTSSTAAFVSIMSTCMACRGSGRKLGDQCAACGGRGSAVEEKRVRVVVPPGMPDGATIQVAGFSVEIRHEPHDDLTQMPMSLDITNERTVDVFDAILGGRIAVNTLAGEMDVKVPPGFKPGMYLRIKGAGMRDRNGRRGDHLVQVNVFVPKLNEEQTRQLELLRDEIRRPDEEDDND